MKNIISQGNVLKEFQIRIVIDAVLQVFLLDSLPLAHYSLPDGVRGVSYCKVDNLISDFKSVLL